MNLMLLHFKKDIRLLRTGLVIWASLLLLDTLFIRTFGTNYLLENTEARGILFIVGNLIVVSMIVVMALLSAGVILVDSPSKRDGYWRTRPIRPLDLIGAKTLFILMCLVIPTTLLEGLLLVSEKLPLWMVLRGMLDRFLLAFILSGTVASFACWWKDYRQMFLGIIIFIGTTSLTLLLFVTLSEWTGLSEIRPSEPNLMQYALWLLVFSIVSILVFRFLKRISWNLMKRFITISGCGIVSIPFLLSWSEIKIKTISDGEDAFQGKQLLSDIQINNPRVRIREIKTAQGTLVKLLNVVLEPVTKSLASTQSIDWWIRKTRIKDLNNRTILESKFRQDNPLFRYWSRNLNAVDGQRMVNLIHPDARIIDLHGNQGSLRPYTASSILMKGSETDEEQPLRIESRLEGRLFEFKKVGQLEMTPGNNLKSKTRKWTLVQAKADNGEDFQIILNLEQLSLIFTRDSNLKRFPYTPFSNHSFVLYRPDLKLGLVPDSFKGTFSIQANSHSSFSNSLVQMTFRQPDWMNPGLFFSSSLNPLELWIIEKQYLGRISKEWTSDSLNISKNPQLYNTPYLARGDQMSRSEFNRQIKSLGPPPPNASRIEAGRYLHEVIKLVEERRVFVNRHHPLALKLSTLVPDHLPMFIEGLNVTEHEGNRCLESALYHGVSDSQKQEILNYLGDYPQLAGLINARGWTEDAKDALLGLLNRSELSLTNPAFKALAWLENPMTYPALLAAMERQISLEFYEISLEFYEILKTIPDLESDLNLAVHRLWQNRLKVISKVCAQSTLITVALRHGITEALEEVHRRLEWTINANQISAFNLTRVIRDNIVITGLDPSQHHNDQKLLKWFHRYKPEDFQFDKTRRRFVLKERNNKVN
ncbi:MAG TPA: hypothetical protein EYG38_00475 [Verrucomicrobia bacterium]|nr:hypothetical protein [Verrucomicrobiota bacterium]